MGRKVGKGEGWGAFEKGGKRHCSVSRGEESGDGSRSMNQRRRDSSLFI